MSKKRNAENQLGWFFLKPFLPYLKPHKFRLIVAFLGMLGVAFFGVFSILLLKPPLEVLLNPQEDKQILTVQKIAEANHTVLEQSVNDWHATGAEPSPLFEIVEQMTLALETGAVEEEEEDAEDKAKKKFLNSIPGFASLREWADETLKPIRGWGEQKYAGFEDWMKNNRLEALWLFAAILIGATLLKGISEFLSKYLLAYSFYDLVLKLKADIFTHIMSLDYAFFLRRTTGFLESRIANDVEQIRKVLEVIISDAIQEPLLIAAYFSLLFYLAPQLTWIALVVILVSVGPLIYFARRMKRIKKKSMKKFDELGSVTDESLRNFRVVKIFGSEDFEVRKFQKLNSRIFVLFMKQRLVRFASSPVMEVLGALGVGAVLLVGGVLVIGVGDTKPILSPTDFFIYLIACSRLYSPMKKLSSINLDWAMARVSADRIAEMLNATTTTAEAPDAIPVHGFDHCIEFKNVSFAYGENKVLDDINFRLERGKVVALVGRSGSGKTTLANLPPRLFDPIEGVVEVDGIDARRLKLDGLRRLFGIVTQDTVLFNESVENNIAYAEDTVDKERMIQSAKAAFAHDFILQLDGGKGYQTNIGQGGQQLSGGQRQRLAIARALYRSPQILIFDEATSSLDVESERYVQQAIDNLLDGRTALIIAHRLSTIRQADEILVMREGRIVERGSHDDLLAQKGEYWQLYNLSGELEGGERHAAAVESEE
jgi:subfamily B ATP-binding cassette protein MsbA